MPFNEIEALGFIFLSTEVEIRNRNGCPHKTILLPVPTNAARCPSRRDAGTLRHEWDKASADKLRNERFLLGGLDSISAVVGSDPGDGVVGRMSTHDGEARQGRTGPSVASEATHLHSVSAMSTLEQSSEGGGYWQGIFGHSEVRPIKMIVAPRRFPLRIQIETVVR